MSESKRLLDAAGRVIPGGVNSPVRAFRAVGGAPPFIAARRGRAPVGRGRPRLHRLRRLVGAAHPRPRRPRGGGGGHRGGPPGHQLRRADRARGRDGRDDRGRLSVHGDGAAGQLGHRGRDERDPRGPRCHRARPARQVRRLLPRPRRQPAGEGRLGRRHLRDPRQQGRAGGAGRADPDRGLQRPRRRCAISSVGAAIGSPRSSSSRWPATWAWCRRRRAFSRGCARSRASTARC